jgi:hypothetical protein
MRFIMVDSFLKRALTLAVLAGAAAAAAPALAGTSTITSEQFAPGWQQRVTPLINRGPGPGASATTIWYVPGSVPKGHYFVVNREGDAARLIDGYAVTITSDPERNIKVVLPQYYGYVELVPSSDVPGVKDANSKVRFEGP